MCHRKRHKKTVHLPFCLSHPCQMTHPAARISPTSQTLVHTLSPFISIPVILHPHMFSLEQWIKCLLLLPYSSLTIIPVPFVVGFLFFFFQPLFPHLSLCFTIHFFLLLSSDDNSSCHTLSFLSSSSFPHLQSSFSTNVPRQRTDEVLMVKIIQVFFDSFAIITGL